MFYYAYATCTWCSLTAYNQMLFPFLVIFFSQCVSRPTCSCVVRWLVLFTSILLLYAYTSYSHSSRIFHSPSLYLFLEESCIIHTGTRWLDILWLFWHSFTHFEYKNTTKFSFSHNHYCTSSQVGIAYWGLHIVLYKVGSLQLIVLLMWLLHCALYIGGCGRICRFLLQHRRLYRFHTAPFLHNLLQFGWHGAVFRATSRPLVLLLLA